MLKLCPCCNQTLPLVNFNWKIKGEKLASYCKTCSRQYIKKHYYKNREYYTSKAKRRNILSRSQVLTYLGNYLTCHPCIDCGEKDIRVLEFDHINRDSKIGAISAMVKNRQSLTKLMTEIKKCEVRCANCHRRKTEIENNSWKQKYAPVA